MRNGIAAFNGLRRLWKRFLEKRSSLLGSENDKPKTVFIKRYNLFLKSLVIIGLNQGETQFENQCDYIEAEMKQFTKWIKPSGSETNKKPKLDENDENPFNEYKYEEHWAYADYKYMIELFKSDSTSNRINNRVR